MSNFVSLHMTPMQTQRAHLMASTDPDGYAAWLRVTQIARETVRLRIEINGCLDELDAHYRELCDAHSLMSHPAYVDVLGRLLRDIAQGAGYPVETFYEYEPQDDEEIGE
jgi:hypothetical protein